MKLLLAEGDNATVDFYSPNDHRHTRTGEWQRRWGEDNDFPTFSQLVICERPNEPGVSLLGLDDQGHIWFDSEHTSIIEAKQYAEAEYQGLSSTWHAWGKPSATGA